MNPRRPAALVAIATLVLGSGLLAASPANAAPQSLFGTTVDVVAAINGESLLGGTAHVPATIGGGLQVSLAAAIGDDVVASVLEGAVVVTSCTVAAGDTNCGIVTAGLFDPGANAVTVRLQSGAVSADYSGTLFAVTNNPPTFRIEWQDAAGTWVDGSLTAIPMMGPIALRCVVTNNSSAPFTFNSVNGLVSAGAVDTTVPITGTLAAGATGRYPVWSGSASSGPSAACSGGVSLADGTGTGGGTGGAVIGIAGSITIDRAPAPGTTVTITGDSIVPPVDPDYDVLLDGVPVAGSPVLTTGPDFDFSIPVVIPASLAPGTHVITVVANYSDRTVAYAAFPFEVAAPQLAATGVDLEGGVLAASVPLGALVLAAGLTLLLAARRRRA